jgi:hypothetical protein
MAASEEVDFSYLVPADVMAFSPEGAGPEGAPVAADAL